MLVVAMKTDRMRLVGAAGKWAGRSAALLLLLFWGAFFAEHLMEWFLRRDGRYPPPWVWLGQFLHLGMLVGLALMLRWDRLGAIVLAVATAAFFAMIKDPDYQKAVINRSAALLDSRLIRFAPLEAGAGFGA